MRLWESFGSIMEVFEGWNSLLKVLIIEGWEHLGIVVEKWGGGQMN